MRKGTGVVLMKDKTHLFYRISPSGSADIRVSNVGYDDFRAVEPMMTFRKQTEYTLHFILEGRGTVEKEDAAFTVEKNQFFFVAPGENFRYYPDQKEPWRYVWFGFEGRMAAYYASLIGFDGETVRRATDPMRVRDIIEALFLRAERRGIDETDAVAAFLSIVSEERSVLLLAKPNGENLADRAASIIEVNYQSPTFTVKVLSEMLHLSHPYLCRLYKKERGLTPESEIIGKRLRLAASLLCSTQKPIYEVANESGYRDELHFAKSFRKHYGTSPREYRKENREL